MFLKLDGIKGESLDAKHKDEISIESFSWGLSQTGTFSSGSGGGAGKVSVQDITFSKRLDKASPELTLACCNGKHIKEGLVTVRKAGEKPLEYLKIKLNDILVSSVSTGGGGGDVVQETLTLNFAKFQVEYQEQAPDGSAKGGPIMMGWDVKANQKV
jgi:type VI secretion system secreted protein Hcp